MTYRIFIRLKSGKTGISRKLYDGTPPPFGTELKVSLTGGNTVDVRIGLKVPLSGSLEALIDSLTAHSESNNGSEAYADEI